MNFWGTKINSLQLSCNSIDKRKTTLSAQDRNTQGQIANEQKILISAIQFASLTNTANCGEILITQILNFDIFSDFKITLRSGAGFREMAVF